jgi:hypothetical protein
MAADTQHWDVGAYVLGVLDPADLASFEEHLATCDSCADEVASLLPVVAMLSAADAESLLTRRPEPRSFGPTRPRLESLRHAVPRHGRPAVPGQRGRMAVAAGVAGVLLAGGSFLVGRSTSDTPQARATASSTIGTTTDVPATITGSHFEATDTTTGATALLTVATTLWGSQIELSLSGVRGPLRCELLAVGADASSTVVASWLVSERGYGVPEQPNPLHIQAATATSLAATSHFEIRATSRDGHASTLVSIPT